MSSTIDYYNEHAQMFSDNTKEINFTGVQNRFLSKLSPESLNYFKNKDK